MDMDTTSIKRIMKGNINGKIRAYQGQLKKIYNSTKGDVKAETDALDTLGGHSYNKGCQLLLSWH